MNKELHEVLTEAAKQKVWPVRSAIRGVAQAADCTYEYARKVMNGEQKFKNMTPVLHEICEAVSLDPAAIAHQFGL
jgi:hypothetical protein